MKKFSKVIQNLPANPGHFRIFTDGSCWPNDGTGRGGWAFIIKSLDGSPDIQLSGSEDRTTNNRMELTAAIQGLSAIKNPGVIELVTDSQYLGLGLTEWMHQWKKMNWKQKNSDLWIRLYELYQFHDVYVTCIRGHAGQLENELCDKMAGMARGK